MLKNYKMYLAEESDSQEILNLYRTHLNGPAGWDENYPSQETIIFDLSRNALFVMKNQRGEIIGTISIDSDDAVESLDCWNKNLVPSKEISRVCVREDMKNQGIARTMMKYLCDLLKKDGCKSVHILVKTGHTAALKSYSYLEFVKVGKCHLFEKDYICLEKSL